MYAIAILQASTIEGGRLLHALDVEVVPAYTVSGPLITWLYDKRGQPAYAQSINVKRFPAADSMLSITCKQNVLDSQFKRFARIITDVHNFVAVVVSLLVDMIQDGYSAQKLMRRCHARVCGTPVLFGAARGTDSDSVGPWQQMGLPYRGMWPCIRDQVLMQTAEKE